MNCNDIKLSIFCLKIGKKIDKQTTWLLLMIHTNHTNIHMTTSLSHKENGLEEYRRIMRRKEKCKKWMEMNKVKRSNSQLVNFAKKYVLFTPVNQTIEDIKRISPIYRFRCYLYDCNELDLINEIMEIEIQEAMFIEDEIEKVSRISFLENEKQNQLEMARKNCGLKVPIMLNLDIYGRDPTLPIIINGKYHTLDIKTQQQLVSQYNKVRPNTDRSIKFRDMISKSKRVSKDYEIFVKSL